MDRREALRVKTPKHIKDLIPDPKNRRKHNPRNLGMLTDALHKVGAARSIVIDEQNEILAGNGVVEAAADAGITKVQVVEADGNTIVAVRRKGLTPEQKRQLAIYDNRTAELADWDLDRLRADLAEGEDLSAFFSDDELSALLESDVEPKAGFTDPDAVPEERATDIKLGDMFQLGKHRLMCGDSTKAEDVARLMDGQKAEMCFTSPPYNAGDSEKLSGNTHTTDTKYVVGGSDDDMKGSDFASLFRSFTTLALMHCGFVVVNVQPLAGNKVVLLDYLHEFRGHFADIAIWDKGHAAPAMAERVMSSAFEFLLFLSAQNNPSRAVGSVPFRGTVSNVYKGPPQRTNEFSALHAATFPIHLPSFVLGTFTRAGEGIYEPFGGTGTTLVAAEQLNRQCLTMELVPTYCQVIIDRWEAFTQERVQKLSEVVRS
jgi:DNA modification methylase